MRHWLPVCSGLAVMLWSWVPLANAQIGLMVTAQAGQLSLSWQDNSDVEAGFTIERSLPNDVCEFTALATVAANAEAFVDAPLADGVRWCYRVRAFNDGGQSAPSNVACGTVVPVSTTHTLSGTFSRTAETPGPYQVSLDGYICERVVGGTAAVRIYQGTTRLKSVSMVNPPLGIEFVLTCETTPSQVTLLVDGAIKLSVSR